MINTHTPRAQARVQMLAEIKHRALRQLAQEGPAGLSLRAVARELGVVPSGLYRYYANRDELLTALIIDAYVELAAVVTAAHRSKGLGDHRGRWLAGAAALRTWARAEPARFQLVYGSPVPGYRAPGTTIGPATAVVMAFLGPLADAAVAGALDGPGDVTDAVLQRQVVAMTAELDLPLDPGTTARAVGAFAELVGLVTLELGGHFVGGFEPADHLVSDRLHAMADDLRLAR